MACSNGVCSRSSSRNRQQQPVPLPQQFQAPQVQRQSSAPIVQSGAPDNRPWYERLWGNIVGENAKNIAVPRGFSPEQEQVLNQLLHGGAQGLGQNFQLLEDIRKAIAQNQQNFGIEPNLEKARRDFESITIPTIANRFLAGNTRNSSGLQNALTSGAIDLEAQLNALRNQYGQQQYQNLLQHQGQLIGQQGQFANMAQIGAQPRNEILYQPENWGFLGKVLSAIPGLAASYYIGRGLNGASDQKDANAPVQVTNNSQQIQQFMKLLGEAPSMFYSHPQEQQQIQPIRNLNPGSVSSQEGITQVSPLTQVQQLVKNLGTPEYQFKNRNAVANSLLTDRYNKALAGRGY